MTCYEYVSQIEDILDDALSKLSPDGFARVLDSIQMILADYEE